MQKLLSPDRRCVCFENLKLLLEQWGKFLHSLRSIERCWSFEKFGSEITCCLRGSFDGTNIRYEIPGTRLLHTILPQRNSGKSTLQVSSYFTLPFCINQCSSFMFSIIRLPNSINILSLFQYIYGVYIRRIFKLSPKIHFCISLRTKFTSACNCKSF